MTPAQRDAAAGAAKRVIIRYGVPLTLASASLLGFLHKWEDGGRDDEAARTVYADKLAGGLPTACRGITKAVSPYPVVVGDVWSQERCDEVAAMVVEKGQLSLADCLRVAVQQETFDALSDHAHHFGTPSTCASRAVGLINAGRIAEGCRALAHGPDGKPVWSYVRQPDGSLRFVQGLYNRQLDERDLCLRGAS